MNYLVFDEMDRMLTHYYPSEGEGEVDAISNPNPALQSRPGNSDLGSMEEQLSGFLPCVAFALVKHQFSVPRCHRQ